jgi:hypothetical protein
MGLIAALMRLIRSMRFFMNFSNKKLRYELLGVHVAVGRFRYRTRRS